MSLQVIEKDGQPEYAVLPWAEYQALLVAAGKKPATVSAVPQPVAAPAFSLEQVVALREAQQLSQEQLARQIGISPHYMAMIESGERQPDGAILRALQRLLGASGQ